MTISSGIYVLRRTVSRRTQMQRQSYLPSTFGSTSATGVPRLDPNNSLRPCADAIVSFGPRSFQLQYASQTLASSPYITFHIAFKNSSFQRPPASDNIYLSIVPCGLDERNQLIVVIQDRADAGRTEFFAPNITACGTTAVLSFLSLGSKHSHRYQNERL